MADLPDDLGDVWGFITSTSDSYWPCVFECSSCPDDTELGGYPELRIAEHLFKTYSVNCLCQNCDFVEGLDPQDPYWSVAHVNGRWYLASTAGTPLMGPYSDGTREYPGEKEVKLLRELKVPN